MNNKNPFEPLLSKIKSYMAFCLFIIILVSMAFTASGVNSYLKSKYILNDFTTTEAIISDKVVRIEGGIHDRKREHDLHCTFRTESGYIEAVFNVSKREYSKFEIGENISVTYSNQDNYIYERTENVELNSNLNKIIRSRIHIVFGLSVMLCLLGVLIYSCCGICIWLKNRNG